VAAYRDPDEREGDRKDPALDGDQGGQRGTLGVPGAPAGHSDHRQSQRGDRHADPLPPSEVKAEEPLGEHCEEDQAAREDGLHDRQWRERERAHVQAKAEDRHEPADQEPSGSKEIGGAAQRMADPDRWGEHRAAVLEQKGDVGGRRRTQREDQSQDHGETAGLGGDSSTRQVAQPPCPQHARD